MHSSLGRLPRALRAIAIGRALGFLGAACAPPFPAGDGFHQPPSPLPAGAPGDIIRSRPARFTLDPLAKAPVAGVTSQQVLYGSTGTPSREARPTMSLSTTSCRPGHRRPTTDTEVVLV